VKTNGKQEVIARTAQQSLVLAALLGMVLSATSFSRAQSSATSTATPAAKSATVPAKAPALPPAKGQHEGITVHGHWTIEVRNPDGRVVTHREFENALTGGGQILLASLLSNQAVPGAWSVDLCTTGGATLCNPSVLGNPTTTAPFFLQLVQAGSWNAGNAGNPPASCTTSPTGQSPLKYCYPTLAIPPSSNLVFWMGNPSTSVVVGGNVPSSPVTFSIDTVESDLTICANNPSGTGQVSSQSICFTNPSNTTGAYEFSTISFTGTSVTPSVSVQAGQAVAVTVIFSFSSPS
jgi:hypothetical protein